MRIDGVTYEFTLASDLNRDGMGLECERIDAEGQRRLILEAFWHDPTGRFTVWSCGEELPFALVHAFLRKAAESCPPLRAQDAGTRVLVYMPLIDEGTEVWRPVTAELSGNGCYRITGSQSEDERWQFAPGELVRCEERRFQDGTVGLVAVDLAG